MAHLPAEVLDKIFKDLPLPQKQECMFVCRQWAQVILSRSIFHTINIDRNDVYESVIAFFSTPSPRNMLIKHFELHDFNPILPGTGIFFRLFPNLKTIKLTSETPYTRTQSLQILELEPRDSQLEVVEDYGDCKLTCYLIQNNMCNNLISLTLNISNHVQASSIFPMVMNMPVLQVLKISGFILSYEDIENIHINLPLLTEFKLANSEISSNDIPINTTPANSVTDLSGSPFELSRYALVKYPNLIHLNLSGEYYYDNEMENHYNNDLRPLLQRVGPSLRSLTLIFPEIYPHVFEELDRFGCRIESLTIETRKKNFQIMNLLAQSGQRESIKELTVTADVRTLQWLREMVELERLTLIYPEDEGYNLGRRTAYIDMNELCECLPDSCESLSIKGGYFKYDKNAGNTYNIRELKLDSVNLLPSHIDKFISKKLPGLHSLSIINNTSIDFCYSYHLPNHHFSLLEIEFNDEVCDNDVLLFASDRSSCGYTNLRPKAPCGYSKLDRYLLPRDVSQVVQNLRFRVMVLTCASVKKLVLNGVEAYLVSDHELFNSFNTNISQ